MCLKFWLSLKGRLDFGEHLTSVELDIELMVLKCMGLKCMGLNGVWADLLFIVCDRSTIEFAVHNTTMVYQSCRRCIKLTVHNRPHRRHD